MWDSCRTAVWDSVGLLCGIPVGLLCGIPTRLLCGIPVGLLCGIPVGLPCGIPVRLLCGIPAGLLCGIPTGLLCGIPTRIPVTKSVTNPTGLVPHRLCETVPQESYRTFSLGGQGPPCDFRKLLLKYWEFRFETGHTSPGNNSTPCVKKVGPRS